MAFFEWKSSTTEKSLKSYDLVFCRKCSVSKNSSKKFKIEEKSSNLKNVKRFLIFEQKKVKNSGDGYSPFAICQTCNIYPPLGLVSHGLFASKRNMRYMLPVDYYPSEKK